MFQIRPLQKNRPQEIPFPQEDFNSITRLITTNSTNYVVPSDGPKYLCIRLNKTGYKEITLPPTPTDGDLFIIHDMNGNADDASTRIKLPTDYTIEDSSLLLRGGPSILVLKYFDSYAVPVGGPLLKVWVKQAHFTRLSLPSTDPTRDEDSVVEKLDGDTFIVLSNPLKREVVFSPQVVNPDGSLPDASLYFIIDAAGTGATNTIDFVFDGCTLQGRTQATMTGANGLVVLKQDSDGSFSYVTASAATLIDSTSPAVNFADADKRMFGFSTATDYGDPKALGFWDAAETSTKGGHLNLV